MVVEDCGFGCDSVVVLVAVVFTTSSIQYTVYSTSRNIQYTVVVLVADIWP